MTSVMHRFTYATQSVHGPHTPSTEPLVIGHRGYAARRLENSLEAFELAAKERIDGVEIDVQLSKDGTVVVTHDNDLSRLEGHRTAISQLSDRELSSVALRKVTPEGVELTTTGVISLHALVDLLPEEMLIDVELKVYADTSPELPARVARIVADRGIADRTLMSSFDPRLIRRYRRAARAEGFVPFTAAIYSEHDDVPRILRRGLGMHISGSEWAKPHWRLLRKVGRAPRRPALVWTVNDREAYGAMRDLGVAGLISDDPGLIRGWIREDAERSAAPGGVPLPETPHE